MINQWMRSISFWIFAAFIAAGCSSSNTDTPVDPLPPADTPQDRTPPPPDEPAETSDVDANGNPVYPGTNRPLPRTFYFGYDRAVLSPDDLNVLEQHATFLRNNRNKSLVVEGHADERGTREYNLALGERRGDSVRSFLSSAGVSPTQIETVSYGEERPEDPGHTEAAWSRNRRAILNYR